MKQAAPSDVFQFAAARSSIEPLAGTTKPATAEMPKKTQPSRFTAGCQLWRGIPQYAIAPETRKQIDPNASGRHTSRSYDAFVSAVSIARKVEKLKNRVPANWISADHHAARGPP